MSTYRAGQRVRVEIDGVVLEVFDGYVLKVRADVDGDAWYFKAPALGCTVTVLAEPRPDEPQCLGAVVDSHLVECGNVWRFVRATNTEHPWVASDGGRHVWSALIDPVVLSEGWTA